MAEATLLPSDQPKADDAAAPATAPALTLSADANDPSRYTVALDLARSQKFRLKLVDADGRQNKQQPELAINVTPTARRT